MTMRVLVADDHSLFRDGIVSLLKAAGMTVVGEAGNGFEAVEQAVRLKPDLVLLDINMPEMDGLEALRRIRAKLPETKVVMLTVSDGDANLVEAVHAGASGYLLKNLGASGFLSSLEGLQRGEAAMTRKTTAQLVSALSSSAQPEPQHRGGSGLTTRETELLQLVAAGLSNKAIAQQLHISENTVKYHMKNILQKMNLQNRAEAAAYAVREGLVGEKVDD